MACLTKPRQKRAVERFVGEEAYSRATGLGELMRRRARHAGDIESINIIATGRVPRNVSHCHQDNFYNEVLLVRGSKRWYVAPPEAVSLTATHRSYRLKGAFDLMDPRNQPLLDRFKVIDMEPGDVLELPPGWWHQVESGPFSLAYSIFS